MKSKQPPKGLVPSKLERELDDMNAVYAGVDEVGVSAIAGKLLAVAIVLPKGIHIDGVRDSKLVGTHNERVRLAEEIKGRAVDIGYGWVEPDEVSRLNVYYASITAMERAVAGLKARLDAVITDFHHLNDLVPEVVQYNIVKADRKIFCVAAASIVAKAERDTYMKRLAVETQNRYCWDSNVGYRSPAHWRAIRTHGLSPYHRKKYAVLKDDGGGDGPSRENVTAAPGDPGQ